MSQFGDLGDLLRSGPDGVNWQVARDVAYSLAGAGEEVPPATQTEMEALVRAAQMLLASYTGLAEMDDLPEVRVVDRRGWVDGNLEAFRYLVDPLAKTIGVGAPSAPAADAMEAIMRPLAPLLLAIQVGAVVGHLSQRAFGLYDLAVPRPVSGDMGPLYFVNPNIAGLEEQVAAPSRDTRLYLALHEVSRRALFSIPWVRRLLRDLLDEYVASVVVDLPGIQERLGDLSDPSRLQELLSDPGTFVAQVASPRQLATLERLEALMSFVEGYADHAAEAASVHALPYLDDLRAALDRLRAAPSEGQAMIAQLSGITAERDPTAREFCEKVAADVGVSGLNAAWVRAENLPTREELTDHRLWLARLAVDSD